MIEDALSLEPPVPPVLQAISFWSAIVLPFLYLPLLVVGLETMLQQLLFLALILLNVIAILLGHRHRQR